MNMGIYFNATVLLIILTKNVKEIQVVVFF